MSNDVARAPGTLLAGRFRIERQLGAGAMGSVYAVRHELTRHRRALKLLHADMQHSPEIVQRFLNEASAAGRVGNPHLVETFDAGTLPDGEPYVVMELLQGETLAALIEREGPLERALAAELIAQAAEGAEAAHRAGIVHRDLKPDNLFVTEREGRPFVKLLDFGVSKFTTGSVAALQTSRAGAIYGTPAYMAPEQLRGELDIDGRSDVFALGAVLFQCVTGSLPFQAATLEAMAVRLITGQVTPLDTLRSDLDRDFVAAVHRCLAISIAERMPSAEALALALAPFRSSRSSADPRRLELAATVAAAGPLATAISSPPTPLTIPYRRGRWLWTGAVTVVALSTWAFCGWPRHRVDNAVSDRPARELRAPQSSHDARQPPVASSSVPDHSQTPLIESQEASAGRVDAAPVLRTTHVPKRQPTRVSDAEAETRPSLPTKANSLGLVEENPFR